MISNDTLIVPRSSSLSSKDRSPLSEYEIAFARAERVKEIEMWSWIREFSTYLMFFFVDVHNHLFNSRTKQFSSSSTSEKRLSQWTIDRSRLHQSLFFIFSSSTFLSVRSPPLMNIGLLVGTEFRVESSCSSLGQRRRPSISQWISR